MVLTGDVDGFVMDGDRSAPCVIRPNQPLAVGLDSRIRVDGQGTLIIQGVAPEDAGNYSCQAANEIGTDEETVTLYHTGARAQASRGGPPPSLPPTDAS